MIESLEIKNFTCFEDIKIDFVPGINIFIGDNGTGKTHILKLLYTIPSSKTKVSKDETGYIDEISYLLEVESIFLSESNALTRKSSSKKEEIKKFVLIFNIDGKPFTVTNEQHNWLASLNCDINGVYIPAKDMLANAPYFLSTYKKYDMHFEKVYADVLLNSYLPPLRKLNDRQKAWMKKIEDVIGGEIAIKGEKFFLKSEVGEIDFMLVSEGWRRLAHLWLLIRCGLLDQGTELCWDEPETNLNPSMFPVLVDVLLELQEMGVQMFIATHSYYLLKRFDLQRKDHSVKFYSLYEKNKKEGVKCDPADTYLELSHNKIDEENEKIYDLTVENELFKKK